MLQDISQSALQDLPKATSQDTLKDWSSLTATSQKASQDLIALLESFSITKIPPLFPKIYEQEQNQDKNAQITESKANEEKNAKALDSQNADSKNLDSLIDIKAFKKLDIRIGEVLECERVEKSDKLLKFLIDVGEDKPRQILSGIAKFYEPKELIGRQVCVLVNLKPAKLMGLMSEGMILSCGDEGGLSLLGIESSRKNGSKIS